mgnify:FL=1
MPESGPFRTCPMCGEEWRTQEDFISDPSLSINGYVADFESLELSLFYFTHHKEGCHSTLTIPAERFQNLYEGPKFAERRTGKEECPGYCLEKEQLGRCDAACECAFNREVIQVIREKQSQRRAS